MAREEERTKRQLCEDAFSHNERIQDFQFICNIKRRQTETSTFSSVYTQTECQHQPEFAAPCNIKHLSNDHSLVSVEQESNQGECDSQNEYGSDFIKQEKSCNESDNEDSNFEPKPPKVAFIVCWSSSFWKPQPDCNRFSVGNLMSVAAVLFSANTYQRIASFFQLANIQWISRTSYYKIQKKIFVSIVN